MNDKKDFFLDEILSQPRVLRAVLERRAEFKTPLQPLRRMIEENKFDRILLTGMGSSHHALYPACIHLNDHGVPAVMIETSELLHYRRGLISERTLLVIVSQSGETVEARKLLDVVGDGTFTLGITNCPGSSVAARSDLALDMAAGPERGPSSKTYTVSLLVLLLGAMALTSGIDRQQTQGLHAAIDAVQGFLDRWEESIDQLVDFLGRVDSLYLLGRGSSLASAMTGALIVQETAKMYAVGMSAGQFRHGPLEVASPGFAAVVFAPPGRTNQLNRRLADDIAAFGGKVVLIGSGAEAGERVFLLNLPPLEELCCGAGRNHTPPAFGAADGVREGIRTRSVQPGRKGDAL